MHRQAAFVTPLAGSPFDVAMSPEESLQRAIDEAVVLVDYDTGWPLRFAQERARLLSHFPGTFAAIEHIGSTSVPGLRAKPIIDVMAGVASMAEAIALTPALCGQGYTTSEAVNRTLTDRQWFMRWADGHRTHHLHVVVHQGPQWFRRLRFREVLRRDPAVAASYLALKERLAVLYADDRESYTAAKADFIDHASA